MFKRPSKIFYERTVTKKKEVKMILLVAVISVTYWTILLPYYPIWT